VETVRFYRLEAVLGTVNSLRLRCLSCQRGCAKTPGGGSHRALRSYLSQPRDTLLLWTLRAGAQFLIQANIEPSFEYHIPPQQIVYDPTTGTPTDWCVPAREQLTA
jgi:hypothetical protein